MGFFSRLFNSPKEQKFSVHRGTRPTGATNMPTQAVISQAIANFKKLHPTARVDAITSQIINNGAEGYVWVFYTE